jgi:hypothetical protein
VNTLKIIQHASAVTSEGLTKFITSAGVAAYYVLHSIFLLAVLIVMIGSNVIEEMLSKRK